MPSMQDPLVRQVHSLIGEFSAPEVVEALVTIAAHYKRRMKRAGHSEYQGWEIIEQALARALREIEG